MLDIAIVGAGLTGLALAHRLQDAGVSLALFEARPRAGGRVLTAPPEAQGAAVDLGASWYWPDTEPRITALIESLGLSSFAQPDAGQVLQLIDPNQGPQPLDVNGIHGGARRVAGGMTRLIDALQSALPADSVHLGHRLVSLRAFDDHVELELARDTSPTTLRVRARRVVLTLPPRLLLQTVHFEPALPESTQNALGAVQTWMAREAKAGVRYERPFWLEQGQSGSAFVQHQQAVLREVWDASDAQGAALAGFCALGPEHREQFARSLGLLVSSQLAQLFGLPAQVDASAVVLHDWATEPLTCGTLDRDDPTPPSPPQADPLLRRPHWNGRLYFGGTETARQASGHLEGALESAARLADFLRPVRATQEQPATHLDEALARFASWVAAERQGTAPRYRQHLQHLLSRQDSAQATQRALLATAEQTYARALEQLAALDVCLADSAPAGRSEITPRVLSTFAGFSKALVEESLAFNAGSCALSNFADEHHPSPDYLRAITADLAAAWREFAWATNDLLCARSPQPA
jgi:monoamine oxidase